VDDLTRGFKVPLACATEQLPRLAPAERHGDDLAVTPLGKCTAAASAFVEAACYN